MRILGIDFGDARIGFATCDKNEILASGLRTEHIKGLTQAVEISAKIAKDERAEMIVVGLPLNMNGTAGARVERTELFIEKLSQLVDVPIETTDERCTTVSAYEIMINNNVKRSKKRNIVDTISAEIILQSFIDKRKKSQ